LSFLFLFSLQRAKLRISERKAKEKHVFLCFYERKWLRPQAKVTNKRAKVASAVGTLAFFFVSIYESTPKTIIVAKVGAAAPLPSRGGERLRIVFGLFFSGEGFSECTHLYVKKKAKA
jgi:hypothetical protein